ncbi:MAG: formylmethanofuran dehydrogenase [Syntrophomonadaceae bacterium]|nr:formylmethanofuran dehydrogenase [Syntrophomonadaceae bacterium]
MCKNMPPLELAIQFHGHICPGLLIGVRAAELAQKQLGIEQDNDEELVAIVENDNCSVDAIQAILGCTFGKGNLIFKDYGKNVWTIISRQSGKALRIAQRFGSTAGPASERFRALNGKHDLTDEEAGEKEMLIGELFEKIMSMPAEDLFTWQQVAVKIPDRATIRKTVRCDRCGEGVMETRTISRDGQTLCPECQMN